jgi:RNA polymerase sigma factor (sigma-70 family)
MQLSWEAFFTRYRPMARAIAASLARSGVEADDVVQEASLALFSAIERDPARFASSEHARNYFLRSVRNLSLRTHREASRVNPLPAELEARDDAGEAVRVRQDALARLVRALDPSARELIARRYLMRQTYARIAAETGIAPSTLHSREKALLELLRHRLDAAEREAAG